MTALSKHFTLEQMVRSQVAARLHIKNAPNAAAIAALKLVCQKLLEPIYERYGHVTILSGYRSPALNKQEGGQPNSQNMAGEAVEIEVPDLDPGKLAQWIEANLAYDQLVLECHVPGQPKSGWVSVSCRARDNRRQSFLSTRGLRQPTRFTAEGKKIP